MKLSTNSSIAIVTPKVPTPREAFAAEELKKYLWKIFPGLYAYIRTDEDEIVDEKIIIGGPEHNKLTANYISEEEFDKIAPGPEGIFIKAYGEDTLILTGSSKNVNEFERGTVYAVYELLERFLGCCFGAFVNPTIAGGEYIPQLTECDLSGIEYIKAAADNTIRSAGIEYFSRRVNHVLNLAYIDWLCKNRYTHIGLWMNGYERYKKYGLLEEVIKRGIQLSVGSHDMMPTLLPWEGNEYFTEHYYQTHPEYYKLMEDGTRFQPDPERPHFGGLPFCNTNPELPGVLAKHLLYWLEKNPGITRVGLSPMDGKRPQCCCDECSKYSKIENYTRLVNAVAREVQKSRPDITVGMALYVDQWDYPEGLELVENLNVFMCVWHHTGLRNVGKADGSCIVGTFYEEDLKKWIAAGATTGFSDYYMGVHSGRQRYMPAADEIQAYWKMCMRIGAKGIGSQMEYYNFWNNIFNFYVFARTGYNSDLSMEDNLQAFSKIFGKGGAYISEIVRIAEATLEGQENHKRAGLYVMQNIDKKTCYSLFEKAISEAETPAARNNVRMFRMAFRYSDLECEHTEIIGQHGMIYPAFEKPVDPTGELYYMWRNYDSGHQNNPGFGVYFPLDCEERPDYVPDHWYDFEK